LDHVLEYTETVWQQLAGSDIFITGGTGFVGLWLLETFVWANERLKLNARMTLLTRDPAAFRVKKPVLAGKPSLELICGDVKAVRFPNREFQYVIHAASERENPAADVDGTRRIIEMARAHGARRFLFTSSGAVYGEQPPDLERVDENYIASEGGPAYAQAKRASESLCVKEASSRMIVVIARLFAFVGPYLPLDAHFAIGNFVRDARMGGPIRIKGDGTPLRSYLYAADMAIWLWTLLIKGGSARTYNVGSDLAIGILDLARMVERVCGVRRGITVALKPAPGEKPKRYVPSIARARAELGLEPRIELEEGIRRTFNFR
jgi:nucleoside-diphosphate-sugar epimerase